MGPRAGLDGCGISRQHRDSIPDRPARSSVAIPTELPGPPIYIYIYVVHLLVWIINCANTRSIHQNNKAAFICDKR